MRNSDYMDPETFFSHLWQDYIQLAPQAERIQQAFRDRHEPIINDHVAIRTLNLEPISLSALEPHLLAMGYQRFEPYRFPEKKLNAWSYVPPDDRLPRLFLSELDCGALTPPARSILQQICGQVDPERVRQITIFWAGCLWQPIFWADYQTLLQESEYAAWVASLGLRANHFTLSVNHLKQASTLESVLQIVSESGIPMNESGGRIKGSPEVLLEQASTLADRLPVEFAGGEKHVIPTCYYEFARRYPVSNGRLYQGFVPASADRIFESTHASAGLQTSEVSKTSEV
ncbi:DUF1338 domain-containing protein [Leptothermofonsia sichuanensis E412]|uniref:DUF1338 domain-containing protein n=1 Tax=Leptothermofonsia sichuanensis TaxID=2917832 RepID=UPI001CA783C9|nr:DUF1338 domain-containing protein [Leptothermofonsia sichuanensis]QZZ19987.1 DUF1338 domain-containing protein [Leptothermofonsia sichuanensis E412]